jgi:hypothetical protein
MTFDQVFVRHISDCRFSVVFAAVEVLEVAVHIFLSPMELPIQSALSIRDWSHIVENGLPAHGLSPKERFHFYLQVRSCFYEKLHHWATVVQRAIYRVKDGRLTAHPVWVTLGNGVYVRAVLDQNTSAIYAVELGTQVKGCDTPARCERAQDIHFSMEASRELRDKAT